MVNRRARAVTDTPQGCWMSFVATETQKTETGATTRNMVRRSDRTSGPNTNLPSRKNICNAMQ